MSTSVRSRQIVFWHPIGPRAGRQNTISLAKFRLEASEYKRWRRHIGLILQAQRLEVPPPAATLKWMASIPRKQLEYLRERLYIDPVEYDRGSLVEWLDEYEAARQQGAASLSTDEAVMRDCQRLVGTVVSDVRLIDGGMLQDLLGELSEQHSENSLGRMVKHWSAFFIWLQCKKHVIESNPCLGLDRSIEARPKDDVRPEWIDKLVDLCESTEERYWLRLLQWTGCRLREGLSLRARDFDFDNRRITITETKNKRIRINPLYPAVAELASELVQGLEPGDRLLTRINGNTCYRWLHELRSRAGVPQWRPAHNALRGTRATQLASDPTITPQQAGMLLGHSVAVARRNYVSVDERLLERLSV